MRSCVDAARRRPAGFGRHLNTPWLEVAIGEAQMEREVDTAAAGIRSVIWATGYLLDLTWVNLPIFDAAGEPTHRDGETPVPGIYLLGLSWLRKQKSSFLFGVGDDAEYLAEKIAERSFSLRDS
jgi:hypothetical protein